MANRAAPAAAPENGYLVARTSPWARVWVDGKDTGVDTPIVPRARIPLAPGPHKVTFDVRGERFSFPIVIRAGETVSLDKQLPVAQ